jgi:hypothetical protein
MERPPVPVAYKHLIPVFLQNPSGVIQGTGGVPKDRGGD